MQNEHSDSAVRITTIIAEGARFEGDLVLNDGVKVEGTIKGNIQVNGEGGILIGRTGSVEGDVIAKTAVVEGLIKGKANIDRLIVHQSGTIEGDVKYGTIRTDEGATLLGTLSKTGTGVKTSD